MIANPAIPHPGAVPHLFTLNDLRMHSSIEAKPSSISALRLSGPVLAVVLAIGAFIWLDPLRLLTPTDASPLAPVLSPSAEHARPTERQEVIAPLTPVSETRPVEVPIAPATVVQTPHVSAPVARPRAASIKPESRGNPMDKTNATVLRVSSEERTAPQVLLTKPEEKSDAPIVLKLGDDTKNATRPAATNDQTPVQE